MSNYSAGQDDKHDHGHDHVQGPSGEMSDKAKIRRDFGVEYEIPAMYILDAKFYTGSTSNKYMVRIVKYTRPKNSKKFCVHSNVKVENVRSSRVDIKKKEDLTLRELYGEN